MSVDVRPCEDLEQFMNAIGAIMSFFETDREPERAAACVRSSRSCARVMPT